MALRSSLLSSCKAPHPRAEGLSKARGRKVSVKEAREAFVDAFEEIQRRVKSKDLREALEEEKPSAFIRDLKKAGIVSAALLGAWKVFNPHFIYHANREVVYWGWDRRLVPGDSWVRAWLKKYGLSRVKDLSSETIEGIKVALDQALERGENPLVAARRIRSMIGPNARQMQAIERYYSRLLEQGVSPKRARELTEKLTQRYIKQRAETIARTEMIAAENYGALEAWDQAVKAGLAGKESEKEWVTAFDERTCPACSQMDGVRVRYNEPFPVGVMMPPLHPNCFSEDTEVFTEEGWKFFWQLSGNERIWTLNMKTEELELDRAVRWIDYKYEGEMVHLRSRTIDCLVTPNHEMVVRSDWMQKHKKDSPLIKRPAEALRYGDALPRTAKWWGKEIEYITIGLRKFPVREFMRFLGWYLSEGSIAKPRNGHWQIKISQEKEEGRREVIELAKKLFGHIWVGKAAIYIPWVDDIKDFFLSLGKADTKHLPAEFKELSPPLLWEFLEAFMFGDGHIRKNSWKGHPEWNFGKELIAMTTSKPLADDLTELALKIGLRPGFHLEPPRTTRHWNGVYTSKNPLWRVSFGQHPYSYFKPEMAERVYYKGAVYCLEMEKNPTLFVRRNGKTLWAGNCRCRASFIPAPAR